MHFEKNKVSSPNLCENNNLSCGGCSLPKLLFLIFDSRSGELWRFRRPSIPGKIRKFRSQIDSESTPSPLP